MLSLFHRIARRLHAARAALWALAAVAAAVFVALVFVFEEAGRRFSFAAIALFMWSVCLLTIAHAFVAPPPVAGPDAGLIGRAAVRIRRAFLWVMALLMVALTGLVGFVTVRAIGLLVRSA